MTPGEAALRVLEEEQTALHWTVLWDLALRRGYVAPGPGVREEFLRGLAVAAREGAIAKTSKGTYRLPERPA